MSEQFKGENIHSPENKEAIEAALERFSEDLEHASDFVTELGASMPLEGLLSFESLENDQEAMLKVLMQKFGVDSQVDRPIKQYSIKSTSDTSSEGDIKVNVFATNNPEVFLGQYTYADGDVTWTIRPLDYEEQVS